MKFTLLVLLAFLVPASLRADVVTCLVAKDTTLDAGSPSNSNGGGPGLFVGTDGDPCAHRSLICFDLSGIPAGATITNVQLLLTLGLVAGDGGGGSEPTSATIGLFPLLQDWGEGTADSTATGLQGTGHGAPANPGDATWNSAYFDQTAWINAAGGGHYAATASASLYLGSNTINTAFTWPSTTQLVADVQVWLNNPSTNFGWELINADETDPRTLFGFYSSKWDNTHFGGSPNQVPALRVTYTLPPRLPEPASGGLATGAALLIVSLRTVGRRVFIGE